MRTVLAWPASRARHHPRLRYQYTAVARRPVPNHETPEGSDPSHSADYCPPASDRPVRRCAARVIQDSCGRGSHGEGNCAGPRCLSPAVARHDRTHVLGARGDDEFHRGGIDLLDGRRPMDRDIDAHLPCRVARVRIDCRGTRSGPNSQTRRAPTVSWSSSRAARPVASWARRPLGQRRDPWYVRQVDRTDAAPGTTPALGALRTLGVIGPHSSRTS